MIPLRTNEQIAGIREAGRIAGRLRRELARRVAPGVTTMELDAFAERFMRASGAEPAQKGYHGYPNALCAAINDVVCHGLPSDLPLREGDLVTLDYVVRLGEWMADTAYTYEVGVVSAEARRLRRCAFAAMMRAIAAIRPGRRIGDMAAVVMRTAEEQRFGIVSQYGGHGIGRELHEPPQVPFVGRAGRGTVLREGMVITIEPMLTIGDPDVYIDEDGWTVRTSDGSWAAQFEHTVAVTGDGAVILTR